MSPNNGNTAMLLVYVYIYIYILLMMKADCNELRNQHVLQLIVTTKLKMPRQTM